MSLATSMVLSISLSTLSQTWKTTLKHVALCKSSSFSKCDTCTLIKLALEATKIVKERAKLFMAKRIHMLAQIVVAIYITLGSKELCVSPKNTYVLYMTKWIKPKQLY